LNIEDLDLILPVIAVLALLPAGLTALFPGARHVPPWVYLVYFAVLAMGAGIFGAIHVVKQFRKAILARRSARSNGAKGKELQKCF
jgi:hypothetical protein